MLGQVVDLLLVNNAFLQGLKLLKAVINVVSLRDGARDVEHQEQRQPLDLDHLKDGGRRCKEAPDEVEPCVAGLERLLALTGSAHRVKTLLKVDQLLQLVEEPNDADSPCK